jgi:hypothetical protein
VAPPNPKTWAAGETVDAPEGNAEWRDTLNFLLNPPRALAYRDSTFPTTSAAWELVPWNNELYDSHGSHSTVSNQSRLVSQEAGLYVAFAQAAWAQNVTGTRRLQIRKNSADLDTGGTLIAIQTITSVGSNLDTQLQIYAEVMLNATDYLQVFALQASGGALNIQAGSGTTFFGFRWGGKTSS